MSSGKGNAMLSKIISAYIVGGDVGPQCFVKDLL
jgi:hypothetical protein